MPYISPERREDLEPDAPVISRDVPQNAGELNYAITSLIEAYRWTRKDSYQTFNDIVGALDNAKDEFRRRVQHPYEDLKCKQNGDVYVPPNITGH